MKIKVGVHGFLIKQSILPGVFNGFLSGLLAISAHPSEAVLEMWGHDAYGIDLVLTAFLLPAISWLIVRKLIQKNEDVSVPWTMCAYDSSRLAVRLSSTRIVGSISWGACGVLLFGLPTLAGLHLLGEPTLRGIAYAVFKCVYATTISALMQPMMACARIQFLRSMRGKYP